MSEKINEGTKERHKDVSSVKPTDGPVTIAGSTVHHAEHP